MRILSFLAAALLALGACAPVPSNESTVGSDGRPLPKLYRIRNNDTAKLQFRMVDSVNALRSAQGAPPVQLNPQLNAAAATHSRDMSVQNRPWHFGSDGSSPIDRLARVDYQGSLVGENISETYETELETLAAWMEKPDTRRTILSPKARDMGFAWFQESNGKIWWTMVMGDPSQAPLIPSSNPSASRLVPEPITNPDETATDTTEEDIVTITTTPST
ncbi:CAP domain-containing protein [uncultured Tateyamaria sp.]|uniref:CAP domain-containing protein n=1 Tax=uncultured Tateyamaria sp. TaxID=455651 RepID=UPI00261271F8|nr:CAP domain-containing protein [uncultured Tateyamaria sp.]